MYPWTGLFVLKMMYHFSLNEAKHYLDFKDRFPYMIEKIQFNDFCLNPALFFMFFCIYIQLD
jgi:aromatic ring hydroxylase